MARYGPVFAAVPNIRLAAVGCRLVVGALASINPGPGYYLSG